jgi:hypothetical protein
MYPTMVEKFLSGLVIEVLVTVFKRRIFFLVIGSSAPK